MGGPDLRVTAALFVKFNRVALPSWNQDPVRIPSHHDDLTDPDFFPAGRGAVAGLNVLSYLILSYLIFSQIA